MPLMRSRALSWKTMATWEQRKTFGRGKNHFITPIITKKFIKKIQNKRISFPSPRNFLSFSSTCHNAPPQNSLKLQPTTLPTSTHDEPGYNASLTSWTALSCAVTSILSRSERAEVSGGEVVGGVFFFF